MFWLTMLVLVTGAIALWDIVFLAKRRGDAKANWLIENARSFFPVLFVVLLIRSFLIQPYQVPTGSLEPTVMPGDFIVVSQFNYGFRLPITNTKIIPTGEPKTGDIVLFYWPKNPKIIFVKRVIGTPGDHITYHQKILTVNGKRAWQVPMGMDLDNEGAFPVPVQIRIEQLGNVSHKIAIRPGVNYGENFDLIVPKGQYFMMGDNRDGSDDSRAWGFVPEENLIGKAFGIWMSWDGKNKNVRWERIGKAIK